MPLKRFCLLLNRSLLTRVDTQVTKAAEQVLELDATRLKLLEYIESRMNILAPNLTVIVGSKVATHEQHMSHTLATRSRS